MPIRRHHSDQQDRDSQVESPTSCLTKEVTPDQIRGKASLEGGGLQVACSGYAALVYGTTVFEDALANTRISYGQTAASI